MTHRTVEPTSFDEYLASDYDSAEGRAAEQMDRDARLSRFPYAVMLKVSLPEIDFANRWCWQTFGPCDGECLQRYSEYRACDQIGSHVHNGKWMSYFFLKIAYDFGFNEWYFADASDRDLFLAHVDKITWGEHYPK